MNRLKERQESPDEEESQDGDFWVVYGDTGIFYVSPETASRVGRTLERWLIPRWVTFVDITGARVRIRGREVRSIYESTELQRTRDRSFHRARRLEEKADRRPWEEED